ncbi:hypothetical protein COCMIDRAFT_95000 [Bipolaris oryzae ATCC 44560]|uniref:mitogen-activated protein kinase kinase n=1 Tax=Bipolaris oryzae ATCC 44560 TaxID=930090 RepID=W6ZDY2_COCMI|nr:uncharacterized protein COCMIDRAFT_95000 [Bipolaris oryzae ATCC 44560]EUC45669.1 hypothetical protein COCMIDRAFT_95000 [Bipolaris oryzae ATCC 44560]
MADSNPSTPDVEVDSDTVFDSPSPSPVPSSPSADASLPEGLSAERPAPRKASTATATTNMTSSSTPLGNINAARNPRPANPPTISSRGSGLNVSQDILARIQAVHLGRKGAPPTGLPGRGPAPQSPGPSLDNRNPMSPGGNPGGVPPNFRMPARPPTTNFQSAPAIPGRMPEPKKSMAERRGMQLPGGLPGTSPAAPPAGRKKPGLTLGMMNGGDKAQNDAQPHKQETQFDQFSQYIDTKTGSLKFAGKAILNSEGVQFASGSTFNISLDEVDTLDELGKGNYGTVYKVRHSRPRMRKPGQGLAGNKAAPGSPSRKNFDEESSPSSAKPAAGTGIVMAMKEMRLELEDSKFATIIMELDVLHRCRSPYIVDFYGAFFQEGAVYICMEFMDGGSIDKLYADGVPEGVLRKITLATTMGLKSLKDEHNIIHRDVKPTNILVNTKGAIKICDFGVSGNLVASIAKTNIGCQSYMAPERISSGGIAQAGANPGGGTYSVQSDIWSLGLTIIECALGQYPYPPETYNNIFSQLSAIVDGDPPDLPDEGYSDAAKNFVRGCLNKIPNLRPTYAMLLQHAWLAPLAKPDTITEEDEEEVAAAQEATPDQAAGDKGPAQAIEVVEDQEVADWVKAALEKRRSGKMKGVEKPALHAAPLDAGIQSPSQNGANGSVAAESTEVAA